MYRLQIFDHREKIHIPGSGKTNELDLLVEREGKVIIVECKATRSDIDEKYVEKWIGKDIPQIRKWLNERYPDIGCFEFQLWSLGGFSSNALQKSRNRGGIVDSGRLAAIRAENANDMIKLIKRKFE